MIDDQKIQIRRQHNVARTQQDRLLDKLINLKLFAWKVINLTLNNKEVSVPKLIYLDSGRSSGDWGRFQDTDYTCVWVCVWINKVITYFIAYSESI